MLTSGIWSTPLSPRGRQVLSSCAIGLVRLDVHGVGRRCRPQLAAALPYCTALRELALLGQEYDGPHWQYGVEEQHEATGGCWLWVVVPDALARGRPDCTGWGVLSDPPAAHLISASCKDAVRPSPFAPRRPPTPHPPLHPFSPRCPAAPRSPLGPHRPARPAPGGQPRAAPRPGCPGAPVLPHGPEGAHPGPAQDRVVQERLGGGPAVRGAQRAAGGGRAAGHGGAGGAGPGGHARQHAGGWCCKHVWCVSMLGAC